MSRCWDCSEGNCNLCKRHLKQVEDFNNQRLENRIKEVVTQMVKTYHEPYFGRPLEPLEAANFNKN